MKKHSILLVDDGEAIRFSVGKHLENEGYGVTVAESGNEAIKMINENHFDVIITDLMMEGIDGIGVLREANELCPDTLVMVLTGHGSFSSAVDALRLGAFDYIQKPCEKDELLMRTRRCINHLILHRKIKAYEKFLPVCCVCKKIRDDDNRAPGTGVWMEPDVYLQEKTEIETSHTYCDECYEDVIKEIDKAIVKKHKQKKG